MRVGEIPIGRQSAGHDQGAVVAEGDAADEGFEVGVEARTPRRLRCATIGRRRFLFCWHSGRRWRGFR